MSELISIRNKLFVQAGLIFKPFEQTEANNEFALEQIKTEHIILPLAILGVFHVAAFVSFIFQVVLSWCKYWDWGQLS